MGKLVQKILMCRPTHFRVEYSINYWMKGVKVDKEKAMSQWKTLKKTIEQTGAKVEVMGAEGAENYPDMVFCANAAVVRGNRAYLANFVHPERKGESAFYDNGFAVYKSNEFRHEGAGDALWGGKGNRTLFSAIGIRSESAAIRGLQNIFNTNEDPIKVEALKLVDKRFYHLDTCFCPLEEGLGLYFPKAFDKKSKKKLQKQMEIVPVTEKDAENFACNAVVVGKNVVMHKGSEKTAKTLQKFGYETHFVDMSEFIKAGGSAKCCTLRTK